MRLYELKKPKDIDKFRKFYQKLDREGTTVSDWRDYITKVLGEYGFEKIGEGSYANVYSNPKYPYVLKVFRKDDGYIEWFNFCKKNQGNPLIPIIKGGLVKITEMFFVVRLEKLEPFNSYNNSTKLNKMFIDKLFNRNSTNPIEITGNKHFDAVAEAIRKYETSDKFPRFTDLHSENVMERKNGQFVIIDPFYDENELWNKRYSYENK